jgi:hypothetical protein
MPAAGNESSANGEASSDGRTGNACRPGPAGTMPPGENHESQVRMSTNDASPPAPGLAAVDSPLASPRRHVQGRFDSSTSATPGASSAEGNRANREYGEAARLVRMIVFRPHHGAWPLWQKNATRPESDPGRFSNGSSVSGSPTLPRSRRVCWQPASSSAEPQAFHRRCRWLRHRPPERLPCCGAWRRLPPATRPARP